MKRWDGGVFLFVLWIDSNNVEKGNAEIVKLGNVETFERWKRGNVKTWKLGKGKGGNVET